MSAPDPVTPDRGAPDPVAPAPGAVAAPDATRLEVGLGERVSDRVNPILVREIQQAMAGKTFLAALGGSLLAVVLVALTVSADGTTSRHEGFRTFVLAMQVLAPIVMLVVPMQAFLSMRQEVAAGTVEHLLLSRLTPRAVVWGKLAAASVLSLIFLSVFAPLVALTFLLRGVDVPTLAAGLTITYVYAVAAAAFGVAGGALCRWQAFRALPLIVVSLGLMLATMIATVAMGELLPDLARELRRATSASLLLARFAMPAVFGIPLMAMVGASALAHPYENRSTAFRLFAVVGTAAAAVWVGWEAERAGRAFGGAGLSATAVPRFLTTSAILLLPFWLFAATEEDRLSPRVRAFVPRRAALAAAAAPFLPGGERGLLFTALLAVAVLTLGEQVPAMFGATVAPEHRRQLVAAWAYVLLAASVARGVRRLLRGRGAGLTRAAALLLLTLVPALPRVVRLFDGAPPVFEWSTIDTLNPFATVRHVREVGTDGTVRGLVIAAVVAVLFHALAVGAGVVEVLAASAERRRRAA